MPPSTGDHADRRWGWQRAAFAPASWWPDVVAAAAFIALTVALIRVPALLQVDLSVRD